ncbi:hypothetical protein CS062_24235, partial [Roseateles chitinivorans]
MVAPRSSFSSAAWLAASPLVIVVLPALIVLRVVLRSSPLSLKAPAMPPLVPALTVTALAL